jgi:hypothetical protein
MLIHLHSVALKISLCKIINNNTTPFPSRRFKYLANYMHLEMLLPELEVDLLALGLLTRIANIARRNTGSAEVHTDLGPERALQTVHVRAVQDAVAHATQQTREVGAAEVGARLEFGKRILVRADRVKNNVLRSVDVHFLRKVRMDAQELVAVGAAEGLRFERGEQRLEPLERRRVFADPDEFDAAEALGRVGAKTEVVNGFEDRGPGCDADTGTDQDGDFVLEDIFCGGSVGSVDLQAGHGLAVLQRNLVHAHGVELVVQLGLRLSGTKSIGKSAGKVTDLANVDGDVGVVGAGSDRKWMPLVVADIWAVEEKPLSRLVLHAGLSELNLNSICFGLADVQAQITGETYRMGGGRP